MDHLVIQEEQIHYNVLYKELEGNGKKYFPSSFSWIFKNFFLTCQACEW